MQPVFPVQHIGITDEEFTKISKLIYNEIGIYLPKTKIPLLTVRLQKTLRSLEMTNFTDYFNYLVNDKTGEAISLLATKISTNYTYFYREEKHFIFFLREALPEITKKLRQSSCYKLRVWTAGCSSGEEPYMLIMLLKEFFGLEYTKWDTGVLATDISTSVLETARDAIYPMESISRIPEPMQIKYFKDCGDGMVSVIDDVKKEITLRRYNLMNPTPPFKNKFHVIFCRNVMIYFDLPTRTALIRRLIDLLEPGGYLFIGHSESLDKQIADLRMIIPAAYQKVSR